MRRFTRRFGPALFWQFAWLAAVLLPLAALTVWLAASGSFLLWLWALGLVAGAMFGCFKAFEPLRRFLFIAETRDSEESEPPEPRHRLGRLAISGDLYRPVALVLGYGFLTILLGIQMTENWGFAIGMKSFLLYWAVMFAGVWIWWALIGRRPAPESLPRPVLPGTDLVDARLMDQEHHNDPGMVTVLVSARRVASTDKVVDSVVLLQLIPAVTGGKRRWIVRIDGESVGVLTQTWEHPRWWPPIEWMADPSSKFEGETISFSPVELPATPLGG
jgi:hypothetical protein